MISSIFESTPSNIVLSPPSVKVNRLTAPDLVEVVVEPLPVGFGITIGNALRRVLLSSLSGVAIYSVELRGVMHEFSSVSGVKEDFPDIVLNIKSIVLKSNGPTEGYIYLTANSEGPVTAGMIDTGTGFNVVNKDLVICNLAGTHSIEMKMKVKRGLGYVQASQSIGDRYDLSSVIPIDAIYNPIRSVSFSVQNGSIGNSNEYDRLILRIGTNGAITPEEAICESTKILSDYLKCFAAIGATSSIDEVVDAQNPDINDILSCKIETLDLSVRSYNCLKNLNIVYVWELVSKTETDLLKTTNFGKKSLIEIKDELLKRGLSLGMNMESFKKV